MNSSWHKYIYILFAVPILGASACLAGELDEDGDGSDGGFAPLSQELRGGNVITGAIGVVEFVWDINNGACTGSMIAPDVLLTASHCVDITTSTSGSNTITIFYHDPDEGRRTVYSGPAQWTTHPSWSGASGYWEVADIATIQIPGRFAGTNYADYLRLYSDTGDTLDDKYLRVYGAGRHTYSGASDDNLREESFEVTSVDYDVIEVDTRSYVSVCKGDSGGPIMYTTSSVPTVAGVLSKMDTDSGTVLWWSSEGDLCSNNDPGHDEAYFTRTNWTHLQHVQNATGLSCDLHTNAGKNYRRCFDLPFIEEVDLEGVYEMGDAVAMVTAIL